MRPTTAGRSKPSTGSCRSPRPSSEGNVVQRHWISRLTGLERSVETVVTLAGGGIWREVRGMSASMPTLDDDGTELRERRFLPYRR